MLPGSGVEIIASGAQSLRIALAARQSIEACQVVEVS